MEDYPPAIEGAIASGPPTRAFLDLQPEGTHLMVLSGQVHIMPNRSVYAEPVPLDASQGEAPAPAPIVETPAPQPAPAPRKRPRRKRPATRSDESVS